MTRSFDVDTTGMTSIADKFAASPLAVLPIEAPPTQLEYSHGKEKLPPLVRIGRMVGFVSILLTGLLFPRYFPRGHVNEDYSECVHILVPALQLMGVGCGITMAVLGRLFAKAKPRFAFKLAIALNLISLVLAASELRRAYYERPIWAQYVADRLDL